MDRIDFACTINYTNSSQEKVVGNNFEKIMALYEIIKPIPSLVTAVENKELQFIVTPKDINDIDRILLRLEHKTITNYGTVYSINSLHQGNDIFIELTKFM